MSVLSVEGLSVSFGGVHALTEVALEVGEGQFVGLIGPNGAGKTTLIDAVTGFVPARGRIELDGQDMTRHPASERARRGLVRTWQSTELFDDLSVRDNLAVASERPSLWSTAKQLVGMGSRGDQEVGAVLGLVGLAGFEDASPRELSQGQRKLVGVARAITAGPRVLLLDEPAAGLDTSESAVLGQRLREVVTAETSVLLVDHDMDLVFALCDRVIVIEFGEVIAEGTPEEVRDDERVVEAYLGRSGAARDELATGNEHGR